MAPGYIPRDGPSNLERTHQAHKIVSLGRYGKVDIWKNRGGPTGDDVSVDDLVEVMSDILANNIFRGRMKLFKEHFRQDVKKAIYREITAKGAKR